MCGPIFFFLQMCPLEFVATTENDDNNSWEAGKKEEKLSKNKAMLWLKMNTINTDVSWFDDIFFPFDRNVQKTSP